MLNKAAAQLIEHKFMPMAFQADIMLSHILSDTPKIKVFWVRPALTQPDPNDVSQKSDLDGEPQDQVWCSDGTLIGGKPVYKEGTPKA